MKKGMRNITILHIIVRSFGAQTRWERETMSARRCLERGLNTHTHVCYTTEWFSRIYTHMSYE